MREPPLTAEVLQDQPHEWSIFIFQISEWKDSCELPQATSLNVRLIMLQINLMFLVPWFSNIRYAVTNEIVSGVSMKVTSAKTK